MRKLRENASAIVLPIIKKRGKIIIWILAGIDAFYIFGMFFTFLKEFLRFGEYPKGVIGVHFNNAILFLVYNLLLLILSESIPHKGKWPVRGLIALGLFIFISGVVTYL